MLKEIDNPYKYSMVALEQRQYFVYDHYLRANIDPLVPQQAFTLSISNLLVHDAKKTADKIYKVI